MNTTMNMNVVCYRCFGISADGIELNCNHCICKVCFVKHIDIYEGEFYVTCSCLFKTYVNFAIKSMNILNMVCYVVFILFLFSF